MPTATNNVSKENGYAKMIAHNTRQHPNGNNNEDIDFNLTKYNETFHITNFDKQILKNVDMDYIREHDKKMLARRDKSKMWHTKKAYVAEQKAKGLIQDRRLVAEVGDHKYFDEVKDRVQKLHPEWNEDELNENLFSTYNKAFKGFAKGFNQTHENLVISRCDTNMDERPPHMHYQMTGMTKTAKGKPSFAFDKALHKTYNDGKKSSRSDDYKAFRDDADNMLVDHFKRAFVADYGKEFDDIELERTGAESGLSQSTRERVNNEVEVATRLAREKLAKDREALEKRERKVKDREDFNGRLTRDNNRLKHDIQKEKDEYNTAKTFVAEDAFDAVQDAQGNYYNVFVGALDPTKETYALEPEKVIYEDIDRVQKADYDDLASSETRRKRSINNVTELREIIDDNRTKDMSKGVSFFRKIADWSRSKFDAVKAGWGISIETQQSELDDREDTLNKRETDLNTRELDVSAREDNVKSREDNMDSIMTNVKRILGNRFIRTNGVNRWYSGKIADFEAGLKMDEPTHWPKYTFRNESHDLADMVEYSDEADSKERNEATAERLRQIQQQDLQNRQQQIKKHKNEKEDDGLDF